MPNTQDITPTKINTSSSSKNTEDDLLWRILWKNKLTIIIISIVFGIASVAFALSKPNIYKATTLLYPANSDSSGGGLASIAGQFGGLASMAGINLNGSSTDKSALAMEIIRSRSFIEKFIEKHDLLVPLMAAKGWNLTSDTLILDPEVYDEEEKKWVRVTKAPFSPKPSAWEAYMRFLELITVAQNDKTQIISISLEYFSPTLAQQWLQLLVDDINEFMRKQDKLEAEASIAFLTQQLEKIQVSSMETVFYQLIEEQTKNMMLTHVKKEYIFKTVDPAQVPDIKAGPKRALIVIIGTGLGGLLSILLVLARYYLK